MNARRGLFAVPVVLFVLAFASVLPAYAGASVDDYTGTCSRFSASGTTSDPYVGVYVYTYATNQYIIYETKPTSGGHYHISVSFDRQPDGTDMYYGIYGANSSDPNDYNTGVDIYKTCHTGSGSDGGGEPAGNLFDGRINNTDQSRDVAAPIAIYRDSAGTIDIYAIDPSTGKGTKALTLTQAELNAQGIPTDGNLVLGDTTVNGFHIILSRLTTGELQVNVTGPGITPYIVAWLPDNPSGLYHVSP